VREKGKGEENGVRDEDTHQGVNPNIPFPSRILMPNDAPQLSPHEIFDPERVLSTAMIDRVFPVGTRRGVTCSMQLIVAMELFSWGSHALLRSIHAL
jgi:hypothetical protein